MVVRVGVRLTRRSHTRRHSRRGLQGGALVVGEVALQGGVAVRAVTLAGRAGDHRATLLRGIARMGEQGVGADADLLVSWNFIAREAADVYQQERHAEPRGPAA